MKRPDLLIVTTSRDLPERVLLIHRVVPGALWLIETHGKETLCPGMVQLGIVKLSEFDQNLGNTGIHNSLIVQHSDSWHEVENQPNST